MSWQLGLTSVPQLGPGAEFLGLSYTAATFGVTTILLGAASRESRDHGKPLLGASTGVAVLASMNVFYLHAIAVGADFPDLLAVGNVAGMALIGLGALSYGRGTTLPEAGPKPTTRLQLLLPVLAVGTLLVVLWVRLPDVGRLSFTAAAGLVLLLIGRQYLVLARVRSSRWRCSPARTNASLRSRHSSPRRCSTAASSRRPTKESG